MKKILLASILFIAVHSVHAQHPSLYDWRIVSRFVGSTPIFYDSNFHNAKNNKLPPVPIYDSFYVISPKWSKGWDAKSKSFEGSSKIIRKLDYEELLTREHSIKNFIDTVK